MRISDWSSDVCSSDLFFGGIVEFGEQLALPAVPYARPDRTNIDDGKHEQQAEAFGRLHDLREVEDRLEIGKVALERRRRHQAVIAPEPRHRLDRKRVV